jgi:predicted ester cyclase
MTIDNQKEISRRSLEMWASQHSGRPEGIFAKNYINHQEPDVQGGISEKSLEKWKQLVSDFHKAFSNSKVCVLMQIAEGDLVANRWEFTATHTGEFMGLKPTAKEVTWTGVQIDRFKDAKIVESWVDWDKYRFLEGLGLL